MCLNLGQVSMMKAFDLHFIKLILIIFGKTTLHANNLLKCVIKDQT